MVEWDGPPATCSSQQEILDAYRRYSGRDDVQAEFLRALKTRWNTTLPVARLPPELMLLVFDDWAAECYVEIQKTQPPYRPYSWISCTHVCRRWRELALSSPCLWRRIVPASPEWTEELLSRSRQTSLCVNFNSCDAKSDWDISRVRAEGTHDLLRHQFHRIREAHMDAFDFDNPSQISAPLLTSLQVTGFYDNVVAAFLFRNTVAIADSDSEDPWVFARDGLPRLKTLDVFTVTQSITWSCLRPSLEFLRTRCIRPRPSPAAWLAALSELPSLRRLELDLGSLLSTHNIPEWSPPNPVAGLVTLRALKTLSVTDECDGRSSAALLSGLVLPAVETIDVDLQSARDETASREHLVAVLDALRPLARGCALDSLQLDVHEEVESVEIKLEPLVITPEHAFPPSLASTWAPGLPYVRLSVRADLTRGSLREYLRAMADVRVLRVGGDMHSLTPFLTILQPASRRTAPDPAKRAPIFPRLNTLRLLQMYWKAKDGEDGAEESDGENDDDDALFEKDAFALVKQASKVMQSRKKTGHPIPYIVLAESLSDILTKRHQGSGD
ncbi:F-box protein [Phanerochaete sordida]|uniref:F-box protein n=1 Tax=Phanerochaete sordida TaxID=48140 RepID=A0A9P3G857_9APHY|nr:F-box protein [Phanerochaete sordida]